ncbi:hypothetical protein MRS44_006005 [Fusarium solani]|uniref:uncharacterized protein n=1 Tax=Fusarium solani TaxID=169388 RepID=UPI0032C4A19D|nr:hypothetical protein MRS44_006005 [Fusarium solani]
MPSETDLAVSCPNKQSDRTIRLLYTHQLQTPQPPTLCPDTSTSILSYTPGMPDPGPDAELVATLTSTPPSEDPDAPHRTRTKAPPLPYLADPATAHRPWNGDLNATVTINLVSPKESPSPSSKPLRESYPACGLSTSSITRLVLAGLAKARPIHPGSGIHQLNLSPTKWVHDTRPAVINIDSALAGYGTSMCALF